MHPLQQDCVHLNDAFLKADSVAHVCRPLNVLVPPSSSLQVPLLPNTHNPLLARLILPVRLTSRKYTHRHTPLCVCPLCGVSSLPAFHLGFLKNSRYGQGQLISSSFKQDFLGLCWLSRWLTMARHCITFLTFLPKFTVFFQQHEQRCKFD